MAELLTVDHEGQRFPVSRIGRDDPITFVMPFSCVRWDDKGKVTFQRESLQADIDSSVDPPHVEVLHLVLPPDGGEIVSPATADQVGYLAACAEVDLPGHSGVAELRDYANRMQ